MRLSTARAGLTTPKKTQTQEKTMKNTMDMTAPEIRNAILNDLSRQLAKRGKRVSKFTRACFDDAVAMVEEMYDESICELAACETYADAKAVLLNGASDWGKFSWGGCWHIYDADIAERYLTPCVLKRYRGGSFVPGSRVYLLDLQANALLSAGIYIWWAVQKIQSVAVPATPRPTLIPVAIA